ncbi:histidine kinase [Sphingomonas sp. GlSt437]|uniref:histidine kinase n=1 Tax=Sphingomonas sp. GlSt437 TaxID=3389970 RepID=UPI003A86E28E
MRKMTSMLLLAASGLIATSASAQSWGYGQYQYQNYRDADDYGGAFRAVCSGQRAHALEARLQHEVSEGEINRNDAYRIHSAIDRLEDQQRHECAEGDRRSVYQIAQRYNGIGQWIDREAHGSYGWRW